LTLLDQPFRPFKN